MSKKKYELTEEHRIQMKPWAEKWIANAASTRSMDEDEKEICRQAVKGLYRAASLEPPPDERIVFVSSPFIMSFAGGFASAIWHRRKIAGEPTKSASETRAATRDATWAATWDATWDATRAATWDATWDATGAATWDATRDATRSATRDATGAATWDATRDATRSATWDATRDATWAATWDATRDATGAATWDATRDATRDATWDATRDATWAATWAATWDATRDATWAATWDATRDATGAATWDATRDATRSATWDATRDATRSATWDATGAATGAATWDATWDATGAAKKQDQSKWYQFPISTMVALSNALGLAEFGLSCANNIYGMWDGGNQWSGEPSWVTFFRYVVKYALDYTKWHHYEQLAMHSGPRVMHEKFCIISDRPKILKRNELNQPHCGDGPFTEWRDGTKLYCLNGVRVPQWLAETPADKLGPKEILALTNAEQRKEGIRKIGIDKLRDALKVEIIHSWRDYELWTIEFENRRIGPYLKMVNPTTGRIHVEGVGEATGGVDGKIKTCQQALAWRGNLEVFTEPKWTA